MPWKAGPNCTSLSRVQPLQGPSWKCLPGTQADVVVGGMQRAPWGGGFSAEQPGVTTEPWEPAKDSRRHKSKNQHTG